MKVTLSGKLFKNAMEFNEILIKENSIEIHNTSNSGIGFITKYISKGIVPKDEEIKFILNKKDYHLLSTMDQFVVEMKGNVVNVTCPWFKGKFANMMDVHIVEPDTSQMVQLNVSCKDLCRGRGFAGTDDKTQISCDGATVMNDRIVITNMYSIYRKSISTKGPEINIPKEALKLLEADKEYIIMTNGKFVFFKEGVNALYSNLIEVKNTNNIPTPDPLVNFIVNRSELMSKLKIVKDYSSICKLIAEGNKLTLESKNDENEISLSMGIQPVKLKRLCMPYSIVELLKILSIIMDEEVELNCTDKYLYIDEGDTLLLMTRNTCKDMEVIG